MSIVGLTESITKTFSKEDVELFSKISLDNNPIHLDEKYASQSIFKKPIVHGLLTASLISAVLANKLPGRGTIYLSQSLQFKKPVFIGDTVTATVKIVETVKPTIYKIETTCANQDKEIVITGEAIVKWVG